LCFFPAARALAISAGWNSPSSPTISTPGVGQEAAIRTGAPISLNNLIDDERILRDLAFPPIEPPYDRIRWDAVVYGYGQKREFRRNLSVADPIT